MAECAECGALIGTLGDVFIDTPYPAPGNASAVICFYCWYDHVDAQELAEYLAETGEDV